MWTQKLTWAPPLYRGKRSGKRAERNPWFPMPFPFSKAPIWPFINTHATNRRARGSDMSGAFIAWRRHLPSMTIYNYPPFISDHDLHLNINDIKIMGGYCRGDEQNSGLRPKGLERSHLKGWLWREISPDDHRKVLGMLPTSKLLSEVINTGDPIVGKGRFSGN